ncbi:1398_t:CDS:2 [Racocetra fulgida]|uniref:1398_t:CDS:1 n=1 Tax=Racocetra fulgida TaxID=60492 RepID=A0A9N9FC95_9GLOM|nr:1398_t:CDS:2 [Racocetra fulgida]
MLEENLKDLRKAQELDLERNQEDMLSELGSKLKEQYLDKICEFKEALALYVKPQGTWNVPIIKSSVGKEEMGDKEMEGDIEKVVMRFLTSRDKLTSDDKKALENAANEFLVSKERKPLIKLIDNFFVEENKLTLEDINMLNVAINQILALKDQTALKAKEILETAVNHLLTLKRKIVMLILGSGGTEKSTFNCYLARKLWNEFDEQKITQPPIPLFIALAPLEGLINQHQDFIEVYLRKEGKLSIDQIDSLRERKFVFILDGYDEIAERDCNCYNSNMFSKWKNAKIIISCRPEYLGGGYEKRFWPKENERKGFQELTITPFSQVEIEQYINNYVDYFQKNGSPLMWDTDKYIQQIKNMPEVQDLASNPLLLKITLNVLPSMIEEKETSQINRIILYDEFIKKWFERAQTRLSNIQLTPKEKEEFSCLDGEGFCENCLQFGKQFAAKIYGPVKKGTSDWKEFLGNRDKKYYLIACELIDSFEDTSETTFFNKQSIMPELAIQQFIVERIQQKPEIKQQMLSFIGCSKKNENIQVASANAITVLMRAKIRLPMNLNNIRVPGADLSNGIFNNSQLVKADLSNVNFQNAKLQNVNLEGASLQNANLKGADLTGANLQGAILTGTDLTGSNLQGANLTGANLTDTILRNSNLQGANLTGANLIDTILRNSNLQGANFHDSYLKNVTFEGVILRVQD